MDRRSFLYAIGTGTAVAFGAAGRARAQQGAGAAGQDTGKVEGVRTTMSGPMSDNAYRPIRLPAKAGAQASMTPAARDELEHHLHCQCGCTLDVYTCRTTDFTCPVSPAMHADVVRLVDGGYTGPEITAAFRKTYGERVLMAPVREGFNWAAYITPFVALGAGAAFAGFLMTRWRRAGMAHENAAPFEASDPSTPVDATAEELERLNAAIRDDEG